VARDEEGVQVEVEHRGADADLLLEVIADVTKGNEGGGLVHIEF
jgi:hypothetical protein